MKPEHSYPLTGPVFIAKCIDIPPEDMTVTELGEFTEDMWVFLKQRLELSKVRVKIPSNIERCPECDRPMFANNGCIFCGHQTPAQQVSIGYGKSPLEDALNED